MSCSGHKCKCPKFRVGRKPKTCGCCHHGRDWHYDSDSLDSGDEHNNSDGEDSDDNNGDDNNGTNSKPNRPSTRTENERIALSLAADLVQGGEYSGTDIDTAKREAKAGLTRQHYGRKQNAGGVLNPQPNITQLGVTVPTPPIVLGARVLKIVMFPNGKESLTADPPVQLPYLTKTDELEAQGLVFHDVKGVSFCKNWSSVAMYSFLEQHLPRPFQYFKEQGFSGPNLSQPRTLPFCILERTEDRRFSVVKLPQNGPTGKFYQDKATGAKGSSFKHRSIVLISKQPIPQRVLSEWKHNPLPIAMGLGDMEVDDEVGQQTHGRASKVRPKPKKVPKSGSANDSLLDGSPEPRGTGMGRKSQRRTVESDDRSDAPAKSHRRLKRNRSESPAEGPSRQEFIVVSDNEAESSQVSDGGSETEHELPSFHTAKRQRVYSPDRTDKGKKVDLSASVSSLCLEDIPPSAGQSTTAIILGSWSTMRKASAPFVVDGDVANNSFEF